MTPSAREVPDAVEDTVLFTALYRTVSEPIPWCSLQAEIFELSQNQSQLCTSLTSSVDKDVYEDLEISLYYREIASRWTSRTPEIPIQTETRRIC